MQKAPGFERLGCLNQMYAKVLCFPGKGNAVAVADVRSRLMVCSYVPTEVNSTIPSALITMVLYVVRNTLSENGSFPTVHC